MEVGVVMVFMLLVVIVKGFTTIRLDDIQTAIREAEEERSDTQKRLEGVEGKKLHLEREQEGLIREEKLLENDKDLFCLKIRQLGAEPIPEDELDAIAEVERLQKAREKQVGKPAKKDEAAEQAEAEEEAPASEKAEEPGEREVAEKEGEPARDGVQEKEEAGPNQWRLLVVDDNEELRTILGQALGKTYDVESVANGFEALTRIVKEKQTYDLVITDLKMPHINGVVFAEHLPPGVPFVVISGFLHIPEFEAALKRLKPAAVFQKPFKLGEIRRTIERVLTKTTEPEAVGRSAEEPEDAEENRPQPSSGSGV